MKELMLPLVIGAALCFAGCDKTVQTMGDGEQADVKRGLEANPAERAETRTTNAGSSSIAPPRPTPPPSPTPRPDPPPPPDPSPPPNPSPRPDPTPTPIPTPPPNPSPDPNPPPNPSPSPTPPPTPLR